MTKHELEQKNAMLDEALKTLSRWIVEYSDMMPREIDVYEQYGHDIEEVGMEDTDAFMYMALREAE